MARAPEHSAIQNPDPANVARRILLRRLRRGHASLAGGSEKQPIDAARWNELSRSGAQRRPTHDARVAGAVEELIKAGATVIGPKPIESPSLKGYPRCDEEVRKLADELWSGIDGKSVTERALARAASYGGRRSARS